MESHLVQQQKGLLVKIPDISNALQALHHLMKKDDTVSCHFELADSVYANAKIKKEDTVLLWLGANVMLEYNYEEADTLLTKNLKVRTHDRQHDASVCDGRKQRVPLMCRSPCAVSRSFARFPLFRMPK
jgi:prefoldin subunit 5